MLLLFNYFFFQAEDGIRDIGVTGVQTCALPISVVQAQQAGDNVAGRVLQSVGPSVVEVTTAGSSGSRRFSPSGGGSGFVVRSEERRVGEEWRSRGAADHLKKKNTHASHTSRSY